MIYMVLFFKAKTSINIITNYQDNLYVCYKEINNLNENAVVQNIVHVKYNK